MLLLLLLMALLLLLLLLSLLLLVVSLDGYPTRPPSRRRGTAGLDRRRCRPGQAGRPRRRLALVITIAIFITLGISTTTAADAALPPARAEHVSLPPPLGRFRRRGQGLHLCILFVLLVIAVIAIDIAIVHTALSSIISISSCRGRSAIKVAPTATTANITIALQIIQLQIFPEKAVAVRHAGIVPVVVQPRGRFGILVVVPVLESGRDDGRRGEGGHGPDRLGGPGGEGWR